MLVLMLMLVLLVMLLGQRYHDVRGKDGDGLFKVGDEVAKDGMAGLYKLARLNRSVRTLSSMSRISRVLRLSPEKSVSGVDWRRCSDGSVPTAETPRKSGPLNDAQTRTRVREVW